MNYKESLTIFLKGLFMGSADIIPGISGGTIALITGIYERLIFGVRNIPIKEIITSTSSMKFGEAIKHIKKIDFSLFIPLGLGIGIAFLLLSKVIKFFLNEYVSETYSFFFGLILASTFIVFKHVGKLNLKAISFSILGFIFAYFFIGLGVMKAEHSLPVIFFSGAIAICAMILPGISGAFILVFLNQYEHMLNSLHNLNFIEIFTFLAGAFLGLVSFSRVLSFLLKNYKTQTMAFLVGIMLGALRLPYEKIVENMAGNSVELVYILSFIGFVLVLIVEIIGNKK